jgi:tRNA modification GTPase
MAAAPGDTIVALSSGRLPAAIAVIRTSGPGAKAAAAAIAGTLPDPRRASLRALRGADGALIDRGLVILFAGPDTATGEDIVEYQCHGSKAVAEAVIAALAAQPGVRRAEPGEFTRRALANGRIDLTQAEGLAELLEAENEVQRKSALLRAEGGLRRQVDEWRAALLSLSAEAEVSIDYADEEDGAASFDAGPRLAALRDDLARLLDIPRVERARDGVRVVVAGPPNAGKSSLVNALAGEARAIVTPIPGTTRDLIEVPLSMGGVPVTLVDTAGLREPADTVEAIGIDLARRSIERGDLLLWLGPANDAPRHPRQLQIASKADIRSGEGLRLSLISGEGLEHVRDWIIEQAAPILPSSEQPGLNAREASLVEQCRDALSRAMQLSDPVIIAEELRLARAALDQVTGHAGVDSLLDALFGRFCLGK